MKKNTKRGMLTIAVLLAIFSVIAFVIPGPKSLKFWFAYASGVFAILFQLYILKISLGKEDAKSRFYGFPIARLGFYYLIIQLIVSIAEIATAQFVPGWVFVVINVIIFCIALIGCITTETMRDEIVRQDDSLKQDVSNMRELQSISATLVDQANDAELKASLKKLADEFRYSDPKTSEKTSELEADMKSSLGDLQQAIAEGDIAGAKALCEKLAGCLRERNRICSVNK